MARLTYWLGEMGKNLRKIFDWSRMRFGSILTVLALLLVSSSCGMPDSRESSRGEAVLRIETKRAWSEATATLESAIEGFEFPFFASSSHPLIAEELNESVNRLISNYFRPITDGEYELGDYPEFSLQASEFARVGDYITYYVNGYQFAGDANHGMPINKYFVFDLKDSQRVSLSQFIPNPSDGQISSSLFQQLRVQTQWQDYLLEWLPSNFAEVSRDVEWWPDSSGVNIFFPVYVVAPYSEGSKVGLLSWAEIESAMKREGRAIEKLVSELSQQTSTDYYLHLYESGDGIYVMVSRVNDSAEDEKVDTVGFWWASEGTYFYRGSIKSKLIDYSLELDSGKIDTFTMDIASRRPLEFAGDSETNERALGPVSDLRFIDSLLAAIEAPTATELFQDAERANWSNVDYSEY